MYTGNRITPFTWNARGQSTYQLPVKESLVCVSPTIKQLSQCVTYIRRKPQVCHQLSLQLRQAKQPIRVPPPPPQNLSTAQPPTQTSLAAQSGSPAKFQTRNLPRVCHQLSQTSGTECVIKIILAKLNNIQCTHIQLCSFLALAWPQ